MTKYAIKGTVNICQFLRVHFLIFKKKRKESIPIPCLFVKLMRDFKPIAIPLVHIFTEKQGNINDKTVEQYNCQVYSFCICHSYTLP